jgi:hypothetical protein
MQPPEILTQIMTPVRLNKLFSANRGMMEGLNRSIERLPPGIQ